MEDSGAALGESAFEPQRVLVVALMTAIDGADLGAFRWTADGEEIAPRVHLALLDSRWYTGQDAEWRCDLVLSLADAQSTLEIVTKDDAPTWAGWRVRPTVVGGDCVDRLGADWLGAHLPAELGFAIGPPGPRSPQLPGWFAITGLDWKTEGEGRLLSFWLGAWPEVGEEVGYGAVYGLDGGVVQQDEGGGFARLAVEDSAPVGAVRGWAFSDGQLDALLP